MNKIVGILGVLVFSLACGGGGGSASVSNPTSEPNDTSNSLSLFYVRYKEPTINAPTVGAAHVSEVPEHSTLSGVFDTDKVLSGGALASDTENQPESLFVLNKGSGSGELSGVYNVAVYGLPSGQAKTSVAQMKIDFSTTISATLYGISATNFGAFLISEDLPVDSEISSNDGALKWGNWQGAVSADGNHLLMSLSIPGAQLFMIGSKVNIHSSSDIITRYSNITALQYEDSGRTVSASGVGAAVLESTGIISVSSVKFTQSSYEISVPTGNRYYRLLAEDSSILALSAEENSAVTEEGFVSFGEEFIVIVNPDNENRPSIVTLIK